jgi:hypothetical protein
MIAIEDQPLAEKILAGALAGSRVPQQFLLYGPAGTGKRLAARQVAQHLIGAPDAAADRAQLDLSIVRASGAQILVDDLEDALRDLATRPVVGRCRVAIVEGAERLRDVAGNRILKPLEEPPSGSHVILVTDRPEDVLATIRSRCVPIPFRSPGWQAIAARLIAQGVPRDEAEVRARTQGPMAVAGDAFWRSMRQVGVEMGMSILRGDRAGAEVVADAQRRMESAASKSPRANAAAVLPRRRPRIKKSANGAAWSPTAGRPCWPAPPAWWPTVWRSPSGRVTSSGTVIWRTRSR